MTDALIKEATEFFGIGTNKSRPAEIVGRLIEALSAPGDAPVDIVLHCPACGEQHIDAPTGEWDGQPWQNPPHRSHLCHTCGYIWRPADVATNGVAAVKTKGKADSPIVTPTKFPYGRPVALVVTDEKGLREAIDRGLKAYREADAASIHRFRADYVLKEVKAFLSQLAGGGK